jgi:ribose 5-phosphate isomerase A
VTDNGNFILDAHFGELVGEKDPALVEAAIRSVAGVVDCGLFVDMIQKAYIGAEDGGVIVLSKSSL